jgi:hypothetical protein
MRNNVRPRRGSLNSLAKKLVVLVLIGLAAAMPCMALSTCTGLWPLRNDWTFRSDVAAGYPGFRIANMKWEFESWASNYPANGSARYLFTLQSEDVPGFRVLGQYQRSGTFENASQRAAFRDNMFNAKSLTRAQLAALEQLWVRTYPGVPVVVGDDSPVGRVDSQSANWPVEVAKKYKNVPLDEVYRLKSGSQDSEGWHHGVYFRLNRQSGTWTDLKGFDK